MADLVQSTDASEFLQSLDAESVDAIITSPPYTGLPGRADTRMLVGIVAARGVRVLKPEGSLIFIVGATEQEPSLPFGVPEWVYNACMNADFKDAKTDLRVMLKLSAWYVWKRPHVMARDIGSQVMTHDLILHFTRSDYTPEPLHGESIIATNAIGFNYGAGVTTPPDLAALLVSRATQRDGLVVDPLAGLGEIGVQAVNQKRRFLGSDLNPTYADIANARISALLEGS